MFVCVSKDDVPGGALGRLANEEHGAGFDVGGVVVPVLVLPAPEDPGGGFQVLRGMSQLAPSVDAARTTPMPMMRREFFMRRHLHRCC